MTEGPSPPRPDDPALVEVLDRYLADLQEGRRPDREALIAMHPELADVLPCLDALEGIAAAAPDAPATTVPPATIAACDAASGLPFDFGGYELIEEVGRGGMGVVYKARQKSLDRMVAVKMILPSHLSGDEQIARFRQEAKAAARVRHPNVVQVHEVGECLGRQFLAMELIEGNSLAERIAADPPSPLEAARLMATVARAVAHLHQEGILHRDLKPLNILLDADGEPFVSDFSLAKLVLGDARLTASGVIAGTPSYMAPEQAAGHQGDIGPASDIYSLGAILYELLTGRPPFREETQLDTLLEVLRGEPPAPRSINPHVPRGLELICQKCLARDPAARYRSADELAEDLERFLRSEPLSVRPPTPGQQVLRWTRRQPALAARLGALGTFYLVETGFYLLGAVDAEFHWKVTWPVIAWALASVILQQCDSSRRLAMPAQFGWGLLDSVMLLVVLLIADGAASPLVVGYPLLIVGSALWFRVRFVWFMTALSLLSYAALIVDLHLRRPELQERLEPALNRHVVFIVALIVMGAVVAYLVHRVRVLSSYFGREG